MKKISRRAAISLLLTALVIVFISIFVVQYMIKAKDYVSYEGNPHTYTGGNSSSGTVLDRNGTVLLTGGSSKTYADSAIIRKATLHLLGDRDGNIEAPVMNHYTEDMISYNVITGLYSQSSSDNTMTLTISADACAEALEQLGDRKGTVGVYNYKTGEILCMISSGTYDPDDAPDADAIETNTYYDAVYMNRFTAATYVPGSIFKLITASAAIDNIPDIQSRTFYCSQQEIISNEYITCEDYHGNISFGTALTKSCNIAFGEIAVELGADTLTEYAEKAGITESLSFDGINTAAGSFDLTGANDASVAWAGIGQYTTLINPCQFMTYVGSIANSGKAAAPYVVSSVENASGDTTYTAKTSMLDYTMSRSTASTLAEMMRNDVVNNYGIYNFPNLYVCAKSGTAEIDGMTPNAMFAGFIQDDDYPLAFIVIVENAGSGSEVCASIAGSVLNACIDDMD